MNPSTDADNFERSDVKEQTTTMAREGGGSEVYEEDDEVFSISDETMGSVTFGNRPPRERRISDVIDSFGDSVSPSHLTKEKSHSFSSYETSSSYTTSYAYSMQDFKLQSPPKGRPISTATDGLLSPPMTPGSDLGYVSTGTPTTSSSFLRNKSFKFSSSSVDVPPSSPPNQRHWETQPDARAFGDVQPVQQPSNFAKPTAFMPSEKSARSYNMQHKKRGQAVIFNHEEFRNMPPRVGSAIDVKSLGVALTKLQFEVTVYVDLEAEKLKDVITALTKADHTDEDCLVVIVLTHGLGTGCLMAKDYAYPIEHLWTPFAGDKCESLAGKPKLFFIQACRGEKLDGGLRLVSRTQTDNNTASYKIPTMSDFLLAFSTFEGYYSWRHPEKGTWFIQCLCEVLEEEGEKSQLMDILMEVSRKVATDYESYNDMYNWQHEQKQVPQINSTLLRKVYFEPKK